MNKTWLIIKREYLTRVRNKTFLLSTFLTPLLLVGVMVAVIALTVKNAKQEKVVVVDKENLLKDYLESSSNIQYEFIPDADTSWLSKGYTAMLLAPHNGANTTDRFQIVSSKNLSVMSESAINDQVNSAVEARLITAVGGLSKAAYDSVRTRAKEVKVDNMVLKEDASLKKGNSGVAYGVGYGAAFLIYITLFLYGTMVMRSVMEEKTNRIAEVVVSSVKPTQLMMGKIIGVGAVGVTQFVLWIVLITSLSSLLGVFFPGDAMAQAGQANGSLPGAGMATQTNEAVSAISKARAAFGTVNWLLIIGCFLFYFIFGYLFYAALFAAVGSAVNEDPQDAQSLMFPITMPIIIAIIIMINAITQPESSLATWSSMIPFFSPIVMMARIPFGVPGTVPWWQLGLSMALLVAGFWATTWASAKIYRTAILLYGKKITPKEFWKWAIRKD
jgi:ABC-2 type transport system permease protein